MGSSITAESFHKNSINSYHGNIDQGKNYFRGLLFQHVCLIWLKFTLCLWEIWGVLFQFSRALFWGAPFSTCPSDLAQVYTVSMGNFGGSFSIIQCSFWHFGGEFAPSPRVFFPRF